MIIEEIKNKASTQLSDWKITVQLDIMKIPGLKKFRLIDLLKRGEDRHPASVRLSRILASLFFFMVKKKPERANVVYSLCCQFFSDHFARLMNISSAD